MMRKLRSHQIGLDQGSEPMFSDFDTDGPMWAGDGPREVRRRVTFDTPFKDPPAVLTALAMVDLAAGANHRVDLSHDAVDAQGFDLIFRTWGDTRVARVRADWTAIGAMPDDDDWDL